MALWQSAWLAVLLWFVCGAASAQGIDCQRANLSHSETDVCASASLRALDTRISQRFVLVADDSSVKKSQRAWLQLRNRSNGKTTCLTPTYRERNAYLAAIVIPPPTRTEVITRSLQQLLLRHAPAQPLLLLPPSPTGTMVPVRASDLLTRAAGPQPVIKKPPDRKLLWFLGGMLLAETLLWKTLTKLCGKCPRCHHWFTRVELDRLTQTASSVVLPILRRRRLRRLTPDGNGENPEFTRSKTISVRRRNQCKMCLYEWETSSREPR